MHEEINRILKLPALILPWYKKNARELPWRKTKNPYHVWLSEIMLQQTRVEAVKNYYTHFLNVYPTISDLANADDDTLLKLWEGLGYYNRAKNLKKAANCIMEQFGGNFPADYQDVLSLPGIGEYTAGAICSICYDLPTPAVDGNVLRVIARLTESKMCIDDPKTKRETQELLKKAYPDNHCGNFTQSLMELGATVCIPNGTPLCHACPLNSICKAHQSGTEETLPVRRKKAPRKKEERTVFVLSAGDKFAVNKRDDKGLLSGLWEFPNVSGTLSKEEAVATLKSLGITPRDIVKSAHRSHIFTHIEWDMTCYCFTCVRNGDSFFWVTKNQLISEIALPTAFRKFRELID